MLVKKIKIRSEEAIQGIEDRALDLIIKVTIEEDQDHIQDLERKEEPQHIRRCTTVIMSNKVKCWL